MKLRLREQKGTGPFRQWSAETGPSTPRPDRKLSAESMLEPTEGERGYKPIGVDRDAPRQER